MPLVLLVEDDPAIRRALSRALTDAGYAVRAVDTALDALRAVTAEQPAVVLLDLGLPDMDGSHALVMIRAVSAVPIIVATARRGEIETIRLLNAGADDYVTKPFSAAHVLARVAAVLRRGRPVEPGPPPALEVVRCGSTSAPAPPASTGSRCGWRARSSTCCATSPSAPAGSYPGPSCS